MDWVTVYCAVDDFCKVFEPQWRARLVTEGERQRQRAGRLSLSEMLTIMIGFHTSGYRTFKMYYMSLRAPSNRDFPDLVSYTRFVELKPTLTVPLFAYLTSCFGEITGVAYIDSTALKVCGNKRISRNRVFAGHAQIGKTTMGWFFGFKLHLVISHQGELLGVRVTPGNVDDRAPVPEMCRNIVGKLFGDKGYISKELTRDLMSHGLRLVTGLRKNMREQLLPLIDKLLLRKRSVIETVIGQLKQILHIDHTRHRSPTNFLVNLLAGLAAYAHQPNKPSILLAPEEIQQLATLEAGQMIVA